MGVRTCKNGDIELAYETIGTSGEPLLLLAPMGNESRLTFHEDFCAALVDAGFLLARFDNRDGGLSTHLGRDAKYSLRDMAGDALAVLDALGWSSAHLFGVSLGGMIGQTFAVHNAARVRTLTTVATSPSTGWLVARPKIGTLAKILLLGKPTDTSPAALGDYAVRLAKITGSTAYPMDEAWIRRIAATYPADAAAALRHLAAFRASGDRRAELTGISVPTLVLHGGADRMLSTFAAHENARVIPDARLVVYPGMGHDLPRELWPSMIAELGELVAGTMV